MNNTNDRLSEVPLDHGSLTGAIASLEEVQKEEGTEKAVSSVQEAKDSVQEAKDSVQEAKDSVQEAKDSVQETQSVIENVEKKKKKHQLQSKAQQAHSKGKRKVKDSNKEKDSIKELHEQRLWEYEVRHHEMMRQMALKREDKYYRSLYLTRITMIVAMVIMLILLLYLTLFSTPSGYFNRDDLTSKLKVAIKNDAKLTDIKHIFFYQRSPVKRVGTLFDTKNNNYKDNVTLSRVLHDIISQEYMAKKTDLDSVFISKVETLLATHEVKNPFDKLEAGQKQNFENIQQIAGEHYAHIQSGMNILVDQLDHKNKLVSEYLRDSTMSLYISLFALLLSIGFSSFQLWTGRSKKMIALMQDALILHQSTEKKEN